MFFEGFLGIFEKTKEKKDREFISSVIYCTRRGNVSRPELAIVRDPRSIVLLVASFGDNLGRDFGHLRGNNQPGFYQNHFCGRRREFKGQQTRGNGTESLREGNLPLRGSVSVRSLHFMGCAPLRLGCTREGGVGVYKRGRVRNFLPQGGGSKYVAPHPCSRSPKTGHPKAGRSDFRNQRFETDTGKTRKMRKVSLTHEKQGSEEIPKRKNQGFP